MGRCGRVRWRWRWRWLSCSYHHYYCANYYYSDCYSDFNSNYYSGYSNYSDCSQPRTACSRFRSRKTGMVLMGQHDRAWRDGTHNTKTTTTITTPFLSVFPNQISTYSTPLVEDRRSSWSSLSLSLLPLYYGRGCCGQAQSSEHSRTPSLTDSFIP